MSNNATAIWSAIAASCSALTAFLVMMIGRRELIESTRPELELTGWDRRTEGQGNTPRDVITFQTIRNVGRGSAFNIFINAIHMVNNRPTAVLSTTRLPILAVNEMNDLNGEIDVCWKNVEPDKKGYKHLPITVELLCWDSRGTRHETRYNLLAIELSGIAGVTDAIAPGVMLSNRTTRARPVWLLKLSKGFRRIPVIRRLFPKSLSD